MLAAVAGCARQDALAEHLCRHAEAGNAEGVRAVLAEGADIDKGSLRGTLSQGNLRELTPLMLACQKGHMPLGAHAVFSRSASRGGC